MRFPVIAISIVLVGLFPSYIICNNISLATIFPDLNDLQRFSKPDTGVSGYLNTTYCCLQAVNHAFSYTNDRLKFSNLSGVVVPNFTPDQFWEASNNSNFPCTASYRAGEYAGAPAVIITHGYCIEVCGKGWERASLSADASWMAAFIGFIIPAIVFCTSKLSEYRYGTNVEGLNIPRRRALRLPAYLFGQELTSIGGLAQTLVGFLFAAFLAGLDTTIWLSICLAYAGPMLLSAAYEAFLDNRVIQFLINSIHPPGAGGPGLTVDMRARLLFAVLAGNLDLLFRQESDELDDLSAHGSTYLEDESPLYHIEEIIYPLRIHDSPDQSWHPLQRRYNTAAQSSLPSRIEYEKCLSQTKLRLSTMLECQYSFGATVGAPIVFFIGSFIYTLVDTLNELGNEDFSLNLAFGMWWMIVPHIAILSGLLLAGNNPNTLEGVIAKAPTKKHKDDHFGFLGLRFELAYPSQYRIQWLWLRGLHKQKWFDTIIAIYGNIRPEVSGLSGFVGTALLPGMRIGHEDAQVSILRSQLQLTFADWTWILGLTLPLLVIPFLLSFVTSYYTPTIGLSCRSLTFLLYLCVQVAQIAFYVAPELRTWTSLRPYTNWAWQICTIFLGFLAVFIAIAGTIMQLAGVYANCICKVPLQYWLDLDNPAVHISIGRNSATDIESAKSTWIPTGSAAVTFLGFVGYVGWWWQRRLRNNFHKVVEELEVNARLSD